MRYLPPAVVLALLAACASPPPPKPECSERHPQLCLDEAHDPAASAWAVSRLETACRGKLGQACFELGAAHEAAKKGYAAKDAYDRGCTAGHAPSCLAGPEPQPRKACDLGDARGCARWGEGLLESRLGEGDQRVAALAAFRKACGTLFDPGATKPAGDELAGRLAGCDGVVTLELESSEAGAPTVDRIRALCALGSQRTCARLGVLLRDGRKVAKDEAQARTLLEAACTAKEPAGCVGLAGLVQEQDPRLAFDLLRPWCEQKVAEACTALQALVASQRMPRGYYSASLYEKDLAALFDAGAGLSSTGQEQATLVCRVVSKEPVFSVAWSVGPFSAGEARGGPAYFVAGGAGLRPGDHVRAGATRQERGYSLGNTFLVGLPVIPGFGETRTYGLHSFDVPFEKLPLQATDREGTLECRGVAQRELDAALREPRAELAKLTKALAGKPKLKLDAPDFGMGDAPGDRIRWPLSTLAAYLGWRHPEVRAALRMHQDFEDRWYAEVRRALPQLTGRAVATGKLDGLRGEISVLRVRCDRGAPDKAPYWSAGDGGACALEVQARAGKEELTPQDLLLSSFHALGEDGRPLVAAVRGVFGPDGVYSTSWFTKAAPGQALTIVLVVRGKPALLGHKSRWFKLSGGQ